MVEEKMQKIKKVEENIAEAVKEEKIEKEVVEDVVEKVEEGKESVAEGEKEVAEKISNRMGTKVPLTSHPSLKSEELKEDLEKKEDKKKSENDKNLKKDGAIVNGMNVHISTKHSIAVCDFIRGKYIDKAILDLEDVVKFKKPIPMRGEIPHRKGIMSGRYPINAVKEFIKLLKSLKSNGIANELELEKFEIFCKANVASRPYKRFGRKRMKRSNVQIKLIPLKCKTGSASKDAERRKKKAEKKDLKNEGVKG